MPTAKLTGARFQQWRAYRPDSTAARIVIRERNIHTCVNIMRPHVLSFTRTTSACLSCVITLSIWRSTELFSLYQEAFWVSNTQSHVSRQVIYIYIYILYLFLFRTLFLHWRCRLNLSRLNFWVINLHFLISDRSAERPAQSLSTNTQHKRSAQTLSSNAQHKRTAQTLSAYA